jgi:hypothetical protein
VVRIVYPVTPLQPTLISADTDAIQFDFNGDIRNVYGFELRASQRGPLGRRVPGVPIVQKPAVSYGDLNIDLTQTANTSPFSTNRTFFAYFFNHQWSYSEPTLVTISAPSVSIEEGYRFSQSLNLLCSYDPTRTDITKQIWQVASSSGFDASGLVINQSNNYVGAGTFTVPATGDLWARSVLFDYISSGAWSPTIHIPLGDLIASDYLASQGSAPPIFTTSSGALVSYLASTGVIEVETLAFKVGYPNGQSWQVPAQNDYFSTAKDTASGLVAGHGYYFYLSMPSAAYSNPTIFVDGPYQNPSQSALAYTIADGRVALSGGALTFYTSTTPTGNSGGGGGGTGGGGGGGTAGYCGVLSSMIKMGDGSTKMLADTKIGDVVDDGYGGTETIVGREIVPKQRVRLLRTAEYQTRVADAHTLKMEYGWDSVVHMEEEHGAGAEWPLVDTDAGMQQILSMHCYGLEDVCHLQLSGPRHTYVLDGFKTHNILIKSETSSMEGL